MARSTSRPSTTFTRLLKTVSLIAAASTLSAGVAAYPSKGETLHTLSKREFTLTSPGDLRKSYDYVIVGGGLSGLVLANRLSEDDDRTVLVLEAGLSGDEVKEDVDAPAGAFYNSIVGTDYDWKSMTVNQPGLNNRRIYWPSGKILGGSTAMNAMYIVRPSQPEVDAWAELLESSPDTSSSSSSVERWNWDNLFEAMKKSETFHEPLPEPHEIGGNWPVGEINYGEDGPMQVAFPGVMFSQVAQWLPALEEVGVPSLESPNGGSTLGGFITPSSINPSNWTRSYTRPAYIDSLPPRANLHILPEALVTRLGFHDKHRSSISGNDRKDQLIANSVEFEVGGDVNRGGEGGRKWVVGVNREVILTAGALGSPKILMHSGVGPRDVLEAAGVDVVHELPGVGQNLQDHMTAGIVFESQMETAGDIHESNSDFARSPEFLSFINDAVAFANITRLFGSDGASALQSELQSTLEALSSGSTPDGLSFSSLLPGASNEVIEGYKATYNLTITTFWSDSVAHVELLMSLISPGTVSIQSALQHPLSRGRVWINSTSPYDPILIDPNYFSHPADRTIMRQGVRLVRELGGVLREMGVVGAEIEPGTEVESDADLDNWLTNSGATTQYHPMGTCAMLGRELGGVVDEKLRVYGLANVRVADTSVYPYEFAAHLASATFGVAESAAEVVREESFGVPGKARVDERFLGEGGEGSAGGAAVVGRGGLPVVLGVLGVVIANAVLV
ncbi:aryl-alcohol oxidase [Coprinopsis cinerea AmutBmut pab1-1]|nr:aryl-alcohol oxidase [Coprinopsis cinerea AmutBmut pab1-1]